MKNIILAICYLISALIIIWFVSIGYQNKETVTVTIQEKWIKNYEKSSTYLVSTDKGVYEVTDLLFIGKFNSSDIYGKMQVGKTYKITSTGYRFQFFSMYKNINEVVETK